VANNPPIGFGSFGPQRPVAATSVPSGVPSSQVFTPSPHDLHLGQDNMVGHPQMTAHQVRAMQQFLNNQGFQVAQDGVFGPLTKSAAAAFRANHRSANAWNTAHGIGVHPAARPQGGPDFKSADLSPAAVARANAGRAAPAPAARAGADAGDQSPPGGGGRNAFTSLLSQLLAGSNAGGTMLDPKSFGNAAAAPDTALAATLSRQIAQNPRQEGQNQADISNWYGLNPKGPGYNLSVLGRLGQAGTEDAQAATDASNNIGGLAKDLASSIGGSANAGSGTVLGSGVDAAGTMAALGTVSSQYANDMAPLLAAEARGGMVRERASNQTTLQQLQDQLAEARGQGTSDRASAVMGVTEKNNALGQQGFANRGNLLSVLAQMQAVDPNSAGLKDKLLQAQIQQTGARTNRINHPVFKPAGSGAMPKVDTQKATQAIITNLGYGSQDGVHATVPPGDHVRLANQIAGYLKAQGFRPGDGRFKAIGDAIFSNFVDTHGRPLQAPPTWKI
jgi:hypothetical protein